MTSLIHCSDGVSSCEDSEARCHSVLAFPLALWSYLRWQWLRPCQCDWLDWFALGVLSQPVYSSLLRLVSLSTDCCHTSSMQQGRPCSTPSLRWSYYHKLSKPVDFWSDSQAHFCTVERPDSFYFSDFAQIGNWTCRFNWLCWYHPGAWPGSSNA